MTAESTDRWWRHAVTYQLYLRSFADGNADGLGDIDGIISRLPYLASLGVDAIWINPWYTSPQVDGGYDVADYRDIDPAFGTLDQAQQLIDEAHAVGLRVILDIVPNHTSDQHAWFAAALAAPAGSAERDRYIFRPGLGPDGSTPPNDWPSVFGGPAWERLPAEVDPQQPWYLHLFDLHQPDLNWDNPQVRTDFLDILRFWFDRGVDGFRIDVAHGLIKHHAMPNLDLPQDASFGAPDREDHPHWDRPEVHEIYREWRRLADTYDPPRVFVAEAWVTSADRLAQYLIPTGLHTGFDFDFVRAPWLAADLQRTAASSLRAHDAVGAPVTWVLSNHDITRHVTRLGRSQVDGLGPLSRERRPSDLELGRRRARAALLLELALPGAVYLYQGEELGLEEVEDLPEELLQDPTWERSGRTERGRDGCRVPLPWAACGPSLGFGATQGWLPQPSHWAQLSVERQLADPSSMLWFYRAALALRRQLPALNGAHDDAALEWLDLGDSVVAFRRAGGFSCVVNTGDTPVSLPGGQLMLASGPVSPGGPVSPSGPVSPGGAVRFGEPITLPADTAAWLIN